MEKTATCLLPREGAGWWGRYGYDHSEDEGGGEEEGWGEGEEEGRQRRAVGGQQQPMGRVESAAGVAHGPELRRSREGVL